MKNIFHVYFLSLSIVQVFAQKQTFDLFTYTPPKGWKQEIKEGVVSYTFINKKDKSWCQTGLYKSTTSKGDIEADFDSEWKTLIVEQYKTNDPPMGIDISEAEGWKIKSGAGKFIFNGKETMVVLTTFSGYDVCLSVVAITPNQRYLQDFENLIGSLELRTPELKDQNSVAEKITNSNHAPTDNGFSFTTTNFDDGWTSTEQPHWVEVTKGNIKVLLHYPKEGTIFPTDPDPQTRAAWDILVAPRYSNLQNFKTAYISTYNRPYLGMGNAIDNSTQKAVFIVFFRKSAGWIEVIVPDKNSFIQQFKFDPEKIQWDSDPEVLKSLDNMSDRNKFAVAASDIDNTGKWSTNFSSNTYYTNIYTGNSAGMSTYSSSQSFEFGTGQTYKWQLAAANSYGGSTNVAQAKGAGTFKSINNWQLSFSDIEGKPKTYDVYFTALKGKRVLWMNDTENPGSGIFTGFSK